MSAICQSFVQNAWRKDICSNCFRVRDEHPETEAQNSVNCSNGLSGTLSTEHNGVNITPSIVTSTSNNNKSGNSEANAVLSCGNNADNCGSSEGNRGNSHQWSSSHKFHRFQNPSHNHPNPPYTQTQGTAIPRISNGTNVNVANGGSNTTAVKFSGTNGTTSTTTKGHIHSTFSGSRSSMNGSSNNINENKDPAAETNYGKVKSSMIVEATITKSSSSSSLFSNSNHHQPHIITAQQQGKGVMTNQHPLKSDNGSVIVPLYHHNNNRQPMTSSALPQSSSSTTTSSSTSTNSTASTGRNISSFIASKNIFNNATTNSNNGAVVGSAVSPPVSETTGFTTTAISATSGGGGTTNPHTTTSTSSSTSSSNHHGPAITVAVACAGSSGLSLPQSANSIKRGNIVSASSSTPASVLASSSASSSSGIQPSQKSFGGGGVVGGFDVVVTCNSAASSTGASHHNSRNLENCVKNGVIESCKKPELPEKLSCNSNNVSNISVCSSNSNSNSGSGSNKGIGASAVIGMNRGKVTTGSSSSSVATADGEIHDRRKVGFSQSTTSVSGDGGGMSEPVNVSKNHGKMARPSSAHGKKGILRNKNGSRKTDKNVRFPIEVVEVIGYGGGPSGISDDEDDAPSDPLDNASVSEVMEKSSTTVEDKELHRLTQKNTNFNSIKTNLLGTTCIEIGPIVGCTGGKSMEGSSKPLVSISTFEARKEPLRIQKKICEDSADDELNEKTVEKHRKFIPRGGGNTGGGTSSSTTGKTLLPTSSSSSQVSNKSKELEIKQQTTTSPVTKGILKTTSHSTSSSSYNSSSSATIGAISKTTHSNSSKSSSSSSNQSSSLLLSKGSGSSTTTIEVNPEQLSSTSTSLRSSKEGIATAKGGGLSGTVASRISSSSIAAASKWSNGGGSSSGTPSAIPTTNTTSISGNNETNNLRNTKPVLKRIQQKNANSETTSSSSEGTSSSYTVNAAVVETSKSSTSTNQNGRNNLVILTNGNNQNSKGSSVSVSNSIANQRNSFLRDIIVDSTNSTTKTTIETSAEGTELRNSSGSSNGVQVICKNNGSSVHGKALQETKVSLMKSELKVDLKPSVNNGKLSHPPFGECLSNRSNGTDDSSEFDDSLEDSGLDIKKCSEISESDEKSGSGSDSGNENDYSDRDRVKIISATGPKSGLFISVDEVEGNSKKPEKLSPDSVLFSSASEMSASGSSESIPEALDTVSNGSSQKSSASSSTSGNDTGSNSTSSSGGVKRAAPRPPANSMPEGSSKGSNNTIYANSQQSSILDAEGLYDDVSFYKNPLAFAAKKDSKISAFEEEDEENIYDDCNTITAIPKGGKSNGGKSAAGSYSFGNGSNNTLDSDGDEETEKVVQRRSDGIEFIGIRKIDSESFLRERSPTPDRSPEGKRERSSSASPKTRRKVNQFFSTIGKKAGAAFSNHVHGYSSKNKSTPVIEESGIDKCPSGNSGSAYKRSLSTDEVSMTRTQEIYATLTPTSLKFKGLAPVLHRLSKMDLTMGDRDRGLSGDLDDDFKEKGYKKHKLSSSIKKFLRFGSKDGGETSGGKYEFGSCPNKTDTNGPGQMITSQISEESMTDINSSRTPTPTSASSGSTQAIRVPDRRPSTGTLSGRPPPPPPPRVHSLDLLNRVGVVGLNGTVRPARPPPPTRHNRVAPSFTSVFNNPNPNSSSESKTSGEGNGTTTIIITGNSTYQGDLIDPNNPPSKPKRKASINLDCVTNSKDLETTYNHITTLNLETLKLIASQTPTKIRRSMAFNRKSHNPLRWSQFHIVDPSKPLIHGHGFVFYMASLEDESCVLLVQESATAPNFSAPFEFPCVETSATFEDSIPCHYITWKASEYVTNGSNVKVFISVMPKYSMYTVDSYMRHSQVPLLHKYFALLQAMNFWDKEDLSDLLVLVQNTEESDSFNSPTSSSPSSVLVYVHPIPHLSTGGQAQLRGKRTSSKTQLTPDFESSMKQLLLSPEGSNPLLGKNDRQVLLKRLNENNNKSVQDQCRLFLQVKLFTPKRDSEELERIKKLRSERAIQQWLDRERAMCMKEAVEQTLQRNVESSISPYKRSYLEFLLTPENSAKAVLDMLIDLLE